MPDYTVSLKLHVGRHPWEAGLWIASHEYLSFEVYGIGDTPEKAVADCQQRCDTKARQDRLRRSAAAPCGR